MNFLETTTPQEMLDRLAELRSLQPDIETLTFILDYDQLLEWLHSVGVSTDQELRYIAPPIPPLELRRIVAAPSESAFLWTGLKDAEMCARYVEQYFPGRHDGIRVLDFGCGCGRSSRFLQAVSKLDVYGSDVNRDLVDWCAANLKDVTTKVNEVQPPLSFDDEQFDFIYSLSVFTHLPETAVLAWLDELARVTADNGIVLLTTQGYPALETIIGSEQHQEMLTMSATEASELHDSLDQVGFNYRGYSPEVIEIANAGEDYGNSFTHEAFIRENWTRNVFDVVEFVPGGLHGWQDVTVLRRRGR